MGSSMLVDGLNLLPALDFLQILAADSTILSSVIAKAWSFAQVALGLGFVIFVHELGHFLAAKTFGVRCDKFYVGFDVPISIGPIHFPRTLGKFTWGETEYGIGIIPLGGYVKMLGQDDDPRKQAEENEKIRQAGEVDGDSLAEEEPLDPRSYPAKPVWQRMIIISAGVVMNLLFAVLLAGAAYRFGVPYTPTVVGSTVGGGPAWQAGLQVGDQVIRYGDETEDSDQVRYRDFAMSVIMRGFDGNQQFPITVMRDGKRVELVATATANYSPDRDVFKIGAGPPTKPVLSAHPISPNSFLASSQPDLQEGDRVVAIDGQPLPVSERYDAILGSELTSRLQARFDKPVSLTVERPSAEKDGSPTTLEVELPAVPVKTLGLGFEPGPIVAIQAGSAAEKAGVQVGDRIVELDGNPVDDALKLPVLAGQLAGGTLRLTLQRSAGGNTDANESADELANAERIEVEFPAPEQASFDPVSDLDGALTLGGTGIAFAVTNRISRVSDAASSAGLAVGDELAQVHWVASDEQKEEVDGLFTKLAFTPKLIEPHGFNAASLFEFLQSVPAGASFKCYAKRDGATREAELELRYEEDWHWRQRGIGLSELMDTMRTDNAFTALRLGFDETARRFNDVLEFLRMLVTGKIGAKGVGGPVAIVSAASSEASLGVSRLLIFLTFLSANLAILNFLPIPALDGGHMVFLLAEAIRGKPVNEALQIRLTMAGVLCLLSLMAFVIVKDIMRLMG